MTTSENPAEKDRADAKMELLALRRQTKKDKEKARKRRRKLGMNETCLLYTSPSPRDRG